MKLRRTLVIALGVVAMWNGILFAQLEDDPPPNPQPYGGDILVRAATNRPNCDLDESFIDAYNQSAYSYRILVERTYQNDPPHAGPCVNCADNPLSLIHI